MIADGDLARLGGLLAVRAGSRPPDSLYLLAQAAALVVLVTMGPDRWGPDSEEWVIHLNYGRRS
ncbi:MAG TPA: hypothetical protein VF052_00270, partial [Solirubrobacterales bacterium]